MGCFLGLVFYLNEVRAGRVPCTDLVIRVYLKGMIATGLLAASVLDKVALIEHVATGIEGGHLEGDSVRQVVQERVEVELLLTAAGDIEGDRLLASHTAQARCRIEGTREPRDAVSSLAVVFVTLTTCVVAKVSRGQPAVYSA